MNEHAPIMVLGLNPAWQKTLFFSELKPGEVNRAARMTLMASGKGINFCRAAATWKQPARLLQFLGGSNGEAIAAGLANEGMDAVSVTTVAETRMCITCLCLAGGTMTELIEPSGVITSAELENLRGMIDSGLPGCSGLALCGTFPPGISPELYRDAVVAASRLGIPVMLDSWKEVVPTLEAGVTWLKINLTELLAMTACSALEEGIIFCFEHYSLKYVAITDGGGNAYLSDGETIWEYQLPRLARVVNPIGAGDTCTAVTFSEYLRGSDPVEAFALGLASASAGCLTEEPAVFEPQMAETLRRQIKIAIGSLK